MDGLAIGDQDLTFPPVRTAQRKFCRPRTYRLYAMEMKSLALFCREVRDPGSLISCSRSVRLRSLQPNKTIGKCR